MSSTTIGFFSVVQREKMIFLLFERGWPDLIAPEESTCLS
jgi:hypothetical protein